MNECFRCVKTSSYTAFNIHDDSSTSGKIFVNFGLGARPKYTVWGRVIAPSDGERGIESLYSESLGAMTQWGLGEKGPPEADSNFKIT